MQANYNSDSYSSDKKLSYQEKIELIKAIEYWQQKRMERIRAWRRLLGDGPLEVKHFFIRETIKLIRNQGVRLMSLKFMILEEFDNIKK